MNKNDLIDAVYLTEQRALGTSDQASALSDQVLELASAFQMANPAYDVVDALEGCEDTNLVTTATCLLDDTTLVIDNLKQAGILLRDVASSLVWVHKAASDIGFATDDMDDDD